MFQAIDRRALTGWLGNFRRAALQSYEADRLQLDPSGSRLYDSPPQAEESDVWESANRSHP